MENNNQLNPVISPQELAVGDRIILLDGYADVQEVVSTGPLGTTVIVTLDGDHLTEEVTLPEDTLLEVEREDSK